MPRSNSTKQQTQVIHNNKDSTGHNYTAVPYARMYLAYSHFCMALGAKWSVINKLNLLRIFHAKEIFTAGQELLCAGSRSNLWVGIVVFIQLPSQNKLVL